jgi:hypothetical protein
MENKPPYRFYTQWKCKYHIKANSYTLVYGAFSGNKPCWHIVLENDYVAELVPIDANVVDLEKIYRVKGRGNNLRFTYQKIRKIARPVEEYAYYNSQDFVPAN